MDKFGGDRIKSAAQFCLHPLVQLPNDPAQIEGGFLQIFGLVEQKIVTPRGLFVLFGRVRVHIAQPAQPGTGLLHFVVQPRGQLCDHWQLGHNCVKRQGRLIGHILALLHLGQAKILANLLAQNLQPVIGPLQFQLCPVVLGLVLAQ